MVEYMLNKLFFFLVVLVVVPYNFQLNLFLLNVKCIAGNQTSGIIGSHRDERKNLIKLFVCCSI